MRADEMMFFIGVLREIKHKDHYDDATTPLTVSHAIGIETNRADYLLRKWQAKGFWKYNLTKTIFTGYFIEENFKGSYKRIYEDLRGLNNYPVMIDNRTNIKNNIIVTDCMLEIGKSVLSYNLLLALKIHREILVYRLIELTKGG